MTVGLILIGNVLHEIANFAPEELAWLIKRIDPDVVFLVVRQLRESDSMDAGRLRDLFEAYDPLLLNKYAISEIRSAKVGYSRPGVCWPAIRRRGW